ncbi:MucR family transcriptional regulator [Sphingomonas quercus]|nr:MucR family transcriptional regulator [Sphingomonas quercus]
MSDQDVAANMIDLTTDIVTSHISNNAISAAELPSLIKAVHGALAGLGKAPAVEPEKPRGAVSVRASIKHDGIVSMIDGRKYHTLRRHLAGHGYTPESYREAFDLPRDYPMVSADYSERRRDMAKKIGLGRKKPAAAPEAVAAPSARRKLRIASPK